MESEICIKKCYFIHTLNKYTFYRFEFGRQSIKFTCELDLHSIKCTCDDDSIRSVVENFHEIISFNRKRTGKRLRN